VIGDGPRSGQIEDNDLVQASRAEVVNDWGAELTLDYAETNLGCQQRIFTGLNEAFKRYERAIILEDDCLPHPDFFHYAETMLEHYSDRPEIMHIAGTNFIDPGFFNGDYALTYHPTPWGWATWRRAWSKIDLQMDAYFSRPESMRERLKIGRRSWSKLFKRLGKVRSGEIESWAYPWLASCLANGGLTVNPRSNLVSNIGFDSRSTHTSNPSSCFSSRPLKALRNVQPKEHSKLERQANREVFYMFFGGGHRKRGRLRDRFGL